MIDDIIRASLREASIRYESAESTVVATDDRFTITTASGTVIQQRTRPGAKLAAAIMLELAEHERQQLGLPDCEAVTGGTALCLRASSRPDIPLPAAPRSWSELVAAELWPLHYLGATPDGDPGVVASIGDPDAPAGEN